MNIDVNSTSTDKHIRNRIEALIGLRFRRAGGVCGQIPYKNASPSKTLSLDERVTLLTLLTLLTLPACLLACLLVSLFFSEPAWNNSFKIRRVSKAGKVSKVSKSLSY